MQIHCNSSFFDGFNHNDLEVIRYEGKTEQPKYFEFVLGHKDINLGSQKYFRALDIINTLKSGDDLQYNTVKFKDNIGIGLAKPGEGNVLLFSRHFIDTKYNTFVKDDYQLTSGNVEYLVYWYDLKEDKEYKIVLPKLKFEKK